MRFNSSFAYLAPIGPNKTIFKLILNANPQMDFIADNLIDWGIKLVSGGFIRHLVN